MPTRNLSILCMQVECKATTFMGGLSLLLLCQDRKVLEYFNIHCYCTKLNLCLDFVCSTVRGTNLKSRLLEFGWNKIISQIDKVGHLFCFGEAALFSQQLSSNRGNVWHCLCPKVVIMIKLPVTYVTVPCLNMALQGAGMLFSDVGNTALSESFAVTIGLHLCFAHSIWTQKIMSHLGLCLLLCLICLFCLVECSLFH